MSDERPGADRCPCTSMDQIYTTWFDSSVMCDRCTECGRLILSQ